MPTFRLSHQFQVAPPPPPNQAAEAMRRAAAHYAAGRLERAMQACHDVLAADSDHFEAQHLIGVVCTRLGRNEEALSWLTRAVTLDPGNARAQYHLGNALLAMQRHAEAETCFRHALARDPGFIDAQNNLGNALRAQERDEDAMACYRRVLALRPGFKPALYNLGLALARRGEHEAAIAAQRAVLATAPRADEIDRYAEVNEALAASLVALDRHEDALAACRAALALKPDHAQAAWNAALSLLTLGRYREAWPGYERRWALPGFRSPEEAELPAPPVPARDALAGRRVLLRGEQGRGDIIQFARYAALVAREAASVSLKVYPDLKDLMRTVPGIAAVTDETEAEPAHDVAVALLSLPLLFGTEVPTIPNEVPYLQAPAERLAAWRTRVGPRRSPRIGLCCRGSQHIAERSVPASTLAPLLDRPGVAWHVVQKDLPPEDAAWLAAQANVADHSAAIGDFADTAALIAEMDLIVSIDTAVAHLAGAMGKPVWVLLRRNADWRWLRGRADSPWYPTARLFRQGDDAAWPPVIAAVAAALAGWTAARGAAQSAGATGTGGST